MREAEQLARSGVKELLVISQDTSAYGVDIKYKTDFWGGRPLKSDLYHLASALGELGIWVRMHYVYPYPHVDKIIGDLVCIKPFSCLADGVAVGDAINCRRCRHGEGLWLGRWALKRRLYQ